MNQRRSFTPQFKTRVVLEVLTKLKSLAQVCREYDLKEQVVTRWKAEFLERAPTLFAVVVPKSWTGFRSMLVYRGGAPPARPPHTRRA